MATTSRIIALSTCVPIKISLTVNNSYEYCPE
jgi:hypothetical protein